MWWVLYLCVHKSECIKHNECLLCARHCFKYFIDTVIGSSKNVTKMDKSWKMLIKWINGKDPRRPLGVQDLASWSMDWTVDHKQRYPLRAVRHAEPQFPPQTHWMRICIWKDSNYFYAC